MNFNLDNFLPYQLSRLGNRMSRALASEYETRFGVNRTQWRIMAVLSSGPQTAQYIADKTVMDKSVISRAVQKLIDKDILVRHVSESDARCSLLRLTGTGEKMALEIINVVTLRDKSISGRLSRRDQEHLVRIFAQLNEALEAEKR